jgi:hypothetical protein
MYKKLLMLASAATLLGWWGCSGSNWYWKAAEFGSNVTNILEHFNIVNGY